MKIAISGTHVTGKSSLIAELARLFPDFTVLPEPYYQLVEEGHPFHDPPSHDDFEAQLERSLSDLEQNSPPLLLDRCPIDLLAYLLCHSPHVDPAEWLPRIQAALAELDQIFFLPVEDPDPIALPPSEDPDYRSEIDQKLQEILLENCWGLDLRVTVLQGSLAAKVAAVSAYLADQGFLA